MAALLETVFMTIALVMFILFFFPTKLRKYFGIAAWIALVAGLFMMLPELLAEGNFVYPALLIFSLLLLYIAIKRLLKDDPAMKDFTVMGGVFCILYVPFLLFKPLADWLIGIVVAGIRMAFDAIGFEYYTVDPAHPLSDHFFNYFFSVDPQATGVEFFYNGQMEWVQQAVGYSDMIVLGCTGITAIALLVAVVAVTNTTIIRKILLGILVTAVIFIVNVFRNVFVIAAYFGQWFPWCEDWLVSMTGTYIPGYASFFWSHNVMCECGAFLVIILLAVLLFKLAPDLLGRVKAIVVMFVTDIRDLVRGRRNRT
ncbi:MAG TPA: archaeosortase A [Methanocorpusculum sp.]|nr:archaeosortase A [Methanocorpusculum sp.]